MTEQKFLAVLPLYNSLIIMLVSSSLNRYGSLMGGLNSIIYSIVYFSQKLYGVALSTMLVSFPIQIVTFILWHKNAYKSSTVFRKMSGKMRAILGGIATIGWIVSLIVLYSINPEPYVFLDTPLSVLGYIIPILVMFAFVEAYPLNMISICLTVALYATMVATDIKMLPYLFYSIYCTPMVARSFINSRKLYAEQHKKEENP